MAKDLSASNEWDEARETVDGAYSSQQSYHPVQYNTEFDFMKHEAAALKSVQHMKSGLWRRDAVGLFQGAVDGAMESFRQKLAGSEGVPELKPELTVDLKGTHLEEIPDEIAKIFRRDVQSLVLSHNQIYCLPYSFAECQTIKFLNLRDNKFKEFPKVVCKLPQLENLDLSLNKLNKIPVEAENMRTLRVLSLLNNQLETVPSCIAFLENLKILRLAGNPLVLDLKRIVNGNDESPLKPGTKHIEYEKDAQTTRNVKEYLKCEAYAGYSGGESSDDPPSTPRPKHIVSTRYPVIASNANTSESESASEIRSPGFSKPPIPTRSHYRVASGQNAALQASRRPGLAPLVIGNERNRSNSEGVLQVSLSTRQKRMGVVSKKTPELGTVDELKTNRLSHHLRGLSHASVLRDKSSNGNRNRILGLSPTERQRGTFVRRLSSLSEQKRESQHHNNIIEGAKGVLWSLHQVNTHISNFASVIIDTTSKRSSFEMMYFNASSHLVQLDKKLHEHEDISKAMDPKNRSRSSAEVSAATQACGKAYRQVGKKLLENVSELVANVDQRYVRTLLLLIYGSLIEARNACECLGRTNKGATVRPQKQPSVPNIHEERGDPRDRSATPTRDRPNPMRRLRSGTTLQHSTTPSPFHSASSSRSAVPLFVNGRSRSSSRSNTLVGSNASSGANTPQTGESFAIPPVPPLTAKSNASSNSSSRKGSHDIEQEVLFERIFTSLSESVEHGLRACPIVTRQFMRCLEVARHGYASKEILDLWARLISRTRFCMEMCEVLKMRLSNIPLKDPDYRKGGSDFWTLCHKFVNSFVELLSGIREAKVLNLIPLEIIQTLRPVQKTSRDAYLYMHSSPWLALVAERGGSPIVNGSRKGSASTKSSHAPSVPATPLSAALGPAAQATIPSTPSSGISFDRSFRGDVFQRAESLLSIQQTMFLRR